jgi:hypothetical protein
MAKQLSAVDKFYIEHHKDKMSVDQLARTIGCTSRTIYNHINKNKPGRTSEEFTEFKGQAPAPETPPEEVKPNGDVLDKVGFSVTKGTIAMTSEASQVGDEAMKNTPIKHPDYVHVFKHK